MAEAEQAQRLLLAAVHGTDLAEVKFVPQQQIARMRDLTQSIEDVRRSVVCNLVDAVVRDIRNLNTLCVRGRKIHGVHTDAVPGNDAAVLQRVEEGLVQLCKLCNDRVGVMRIFDQLAGVENAAGDDLGAVYDLKFCIQLFKRLHFGVQIGIVIVGKNNLVFAHWTKPAFRAMWSIPSMEKRSIVLLLEIHVTVVPGIILRMM